MALLLTVLGQFGRLNNMEPLIGEIRYFAGNFAPRDWAFCQGQMLSIASNTALYSIIGDRFGGDGRTTMALPKIEDLNGCKAIIALEGVYPSRS
jgi:microcystin-dependent protein